VGRPSSFQNPTLHQPAGVVWQAGGAQHPLLHEPAGVDWQAGGAQHPPLHQPAGVVRQAGLQGVLVPQQDLGYAKEIR